MLMPAGQAALAQAAGPDRMGRVMSLFGLPMLLIPTLGPVIGGAIVEHASWRWIFYINVPVSLVAVLAAVRFLPAARPAAAPGWTCADSPCCPPASPPSSTACPSSATTPRLTAQGSSPEWWPVPP
jgi:MFS family permease